MTIVNSDTGEVMEPLSFDRAVELTEQIRMAADDLFDLAVEAYHGQIWRVLEYESWDAYLSGEFGELRLRLPREERQEKVASLREQGLSLRAIASVTGIDKNTVMSDVSEFQTPDRVTGVDGKSYESTQPKPPTRSQEVKDMTPEERESCPYCGQDLPDRLQIPPDRRR